MFQILTLNQLSEKGISRFSSDAYQVSDASENPAAILVRSQKIQPENIPSSVLAIARAGAGVNNIPVEACSQKGIPVFNTPGANANAVKELVLCGLLLASRDILGGVKYVQTLDTLDAEAMHKAVEKGKKNFRGQELKGKTLGVIGLGAIGSLVAETGLSMDMNVVGYDPKLSVDAAWRLPKKVKKMENVATLLAQSDYVSLHLPVLESTRNLINKESIKALKHGASILNFARDGIVELSAMVDALQSGHVSKYISDFPHPSLLQEENSILIPHLGASTSESEENCAIMAANQIIDFLEHGNIKNSVNFPVCSLERTEGHRIAVVNQNNPSVLGHLLSIIADHGINVIDLLNKSRDSIAYNLIDLDTSPSSELRKELEGVDGVLTVRMI